MKQLERGTPRAEAAAEAAWKSYAGLDVADVKAVRAESVVAWLVRAKFWSQLGTKAEHAAAMIVGIEQKRDPAGLGRISANEWKAAIEKWQGFSPRLGRDAYSWHAVVFGLLKSHGLTDAADSRTLANALKQRARGAYSDAAVAENEDAPRDFPRFTRGHHKS
ncbi:MAG TPA: hypothetical protein VHB21_08900 [Minicystis sp.]|nr:hypothetical protein [Minicystis sp.]